MRAFFAMIWDARHQEANRLSTRLQVELETRVLKMDRRLETVGFALYDLTEGSNSSSILPVRDGAGHIHGAIFGTLFESGQDHDASLPISTMTQEMARAVCSRDGRQLLAGFWGSYVAFLRHGDRVFVVADPTSAVPCFYMHRSGITFVFSHLEKCDFLDRHNLSINQDFIRSLLTYDKIQNGETGLNEIRELPGGYRLDATSARLPTTLLWDPRSFAARDRQVSIRDAKAGLQQTVRYIVRSHTACHQDIWLNLSGGLDSAIVAAFLAEAPPSGMLGAIHFVMQSRDPTETVYARAVAAHTGLELEELPIEATTPLPGPLDHPLTTRPYRQFLGQDHSARISQSLPGGNRAVFTGQGGDHLFLETRSPLGFADHLLRHGLAGDTGEELLNAAHLSGKSIWAVLQETLPLLAGKRESAVVSAIRNRQTRVSEAAFSGIEPTDLVPGWACEPDGVLPGKFDQVASLVHMFQIRDTIDVPGAAETVHPLISQPLIEYCLGLPVYRLAAHGRSRGLARLAMEGLVPDKVRLRKSKGNASRFFVDQLAANRDRIGETLINGELVSAGLIDPATVRAFLSRDAFRRERSGRMMLIYYVIEAWLQRWKAELSRPGPATSQRNSRLTRR